MANVTLHIGGRTYSVTCADGEEDHLVSLGLAIDAKVHSSGMAGQGEVRQLLFAALLLADEVQEVRAGVPASAAEASDPVTQRLAPALEALAERLEKCATDLER
jgi:cell division protein ZapA